jgi:hypothetical protein
MTGLSLVNHPRRFQEGQQLAFPFPVQPSRYGHRPRSGQTAFFGLCLGLGLGRLGLPELVGISNNSVIRS